MYRNEISVEDATEVPQIGEVRDSAISHIDDFFEDDDAEEPETIKDSPFLELAIKCSPDYLGDEKQITLPEFKLEEYEQDYAADDDEIMPDYFKRVLELIEDEDPRYSFVLDDDFDIEFSTPELEEPEHEEEEEKLVPADWSELLN